VCIKIWPCKHRKDPSEKKKEGEAFVLKKNEKRKEKNIMQKDAGYIKAQQLSFVFLFVLLCNSHHLPKENLKRIFFFFIVEDDDEEKN
jgi:hypothetical protein